MRIKINKNIGNSSLEFDIEEKEEIDALFTAGTIASMPTVCSLCGSDDVQLSAKKAKGYTFVNVHCNKCFANANLGQYKEGGIFWKQFEEYVKKEPELE